MVEVLELTELLERLPHTLSGGQKQRVTLGRALLCSPDLLLLDEPLAALDQPLKDRILDYVEQVLKEWRLPTIYVTHELAELKRLNPEVALIDNGRVNYPGTGSEANSC